MKKTIHDDILQTIRRSEKSINRISKESGVSRSTIGDWLNKRSLPTVFNAEAVLNTIGYTLILKKTGNDDAGNENESDSLST